MNIEYLHLVPNSVNPNITSSVPFRAILVLEEPVSIEWQDDLSKGLINAGCLYMMAWGVEASSWDDALDHANLEAFNYGDVPEIQSVITTWHDTESLRQVFGYSKKHAHHPAVELKKTVIIHIATINKENELFSIYAGA